MVKKTKPSTEATHSSVEERVREVSNAGANQEKDVRLPIFKAAEAPFTGKAVGFIYYRHEGHPDFLVLTLDIEKGFVVKQTLVKEAPLNRVESVAWAEVWLERTASKMAKEYPPEN